MNDEILRVAAPPDPADAKDKKRGAYCLLRPGYYFVPLTPALPSAAAFGPFPTPTLARFLSTSARSLGLLPSP